VLERILAASLPRVWRDAPPALLRRTDEDGVLTSRYRVGHAGDARVVVIATDAAGTIHDLAVRPDPDNR
jgi:hypothetical protein